MNYYFHPLGLFCPTCNQQGQIMSVQTALTKQVAVTAWCRNCKHMFYETYSHAELLALAKEGDRVQNEEEHILAFYEQQMHEHLNPKLLPPEKEDGA